VFRREEAPVGLHSWSPPKERGSLNYITISSGLKKVC